MAARTASRGLVLQRYALGNGESGIIAVVGHPLVQASGSVIDQCFYGRSYRKRTKLLFGHVDAASVEVIRPVRCSGRRVCDFTLKKHQHLEGAACKQAQHFPTHMCDDIASVLCEPTLHSRTVNIASGMSRDEK